MPHRVPHPNYGKCYQNNVWYSIVHLEPMWYGIVYKYAIIVRSFWHRLGIMLGSMMARKEGGSVDNKVTPSVPRTDGVTSLPTIPPFLPPATALLPMPPPSHARPLFIAESHPSQPLPVAQLPHEVAPPCQNGLVPVLHPSRDKPWTWGMDQYQAILARWRSFVWQLRHWQWLVWKRFCYEVRRLMVR